MFGMQVDLLLSCVLQRQDTPSGMDVDIPTSLPQQTATLSSLLTPFQRPESLLLPITHLLHADPPLAALLLHPVMSALYTRLGPLQQAGLVTHMSGLLSSGALLGSGSAAPVPLPVYLQPAFQLSRAESSCPPAHLSGGGLKVCISAILSPSYTSDGFILLPDGRMSTCNTGEQWRGSAAGLPHASPSACGPARRPPRGLGHRMQVMGPSGVIPRV